MTIEQVERFYCRRCDYITEDKLEIERIKEARACPVCNNGKTKGWVRRQDDR